MKAILMSIQPKWCELIASGKKTVEVRKTKPKLEVPFKVYVYETKDKRYENIGVCGWKKDGTAYIFKHHCGKVIGEFVCDRIECLFNVSTDKWEHLSGNIHEWHKMLVNGKAMMTESELHTYCNGGNSYAWYITDLVIYDKPRELWEFKSKCKEYGSDNPNCTECHYYIDGMCYEYDESDCGCNGLKPITRPPQSWCYVEEENNGSST